MVIAETRRLFLRCFHVADLDAMMDVFGDAEVMRFSPGPQSRDWVQTWLQGCLEDYYCKWGFGLWAVVHRPDLRVIGFETARRAGFSRVRLETGVRQPEAIRLYEAAGYGRIDNYGKYAGT